MKAPERIYLTPQFISAVYPGIKPEADHIEYLRSDLALLSQQEKTGREVARGFAEWIFENGISYSPILKCWLIWSEEEDAEVYFCNTTDELFTEYLKTLSNEQARD